MRRRLLAIALPLLAVVPAVSACGAQRAPTPDTATPLAPGGTVAVRFADLGVSLRAPRSWHQARGPQPEILQLSSGRATVTLWRYPRTEPLPRTDAGLRQAQTDLLAATKVRDPSFRESRTRQTRVGGSPALDLRGMATVAGQQRTVRSVHVYGAGAELVVDALAEPAQAARVDREVVQPLVASLRIAPAKGGG